MFCYRKIAALLPALLWTVNVHAGDCLEIASTEDLPKSVKSGKCYKFEKDFLIQDEILVAGEVASAPDVKVTIAKGASVNILKGGKLVLGGQTKIDGAVITVGEYGRVENQGSLDISGSTIEILRGGSFKNNGSSLFDVSDISLAKDGKILNQGQMVFVGARLNAVSSSIENNADFRLASRVKLECSAFSAFYQNGSLELSQDGLLSFDDSSGMTNKGIVKLSGQLWLKGVSRLNNKGSLSVGEKGEVRASGGSVINNAGAFRSAGNTVIEDHALFDNLKNFKVEQNAVLQVDPEAVLTNYGLVVALGKIVIQNADSIVPKRNFFIGEGRVLTNSKQLLEKKEVKEQWPPLP